jgi:hypothetical protein
VKVDRSIQPCPECYRADDVRVPTLDPDGNLEFVCTDGHGGAGPVVFLRPARAAEPAARSRTAVVRVDERKTDDLLDPILACIGADDGWVEYGVVEHRLREVAPAIFARHVAEAGHIMFGPKSSTASGVRFAMALRRLADRGVLQGRIDASTGAAWKHDRIISFWRLVPESPDEAARQPTTVLTWAAYCAALGRSDDWTPADRSGLTSPSQQN